MARQAAAPATLTAHHDCEFREVLDRVGDKWTLLVIAMLEQRPTARARFSELKRSIPGISQRMLTATLRSLERDGLLTQIRQLTAGNFVAIHSPRRSGNPRLKRRVHLSQRLPVGLHVAHRGQRQSGVVFGVRGGGHD